MRFPRILMQRAGGAAGGNGGGDDDDDDADDPAFTARFNKLFHKAMGEREKRFETKILRSMDTMLGSKFDDLRTVLIDSDTDDEPSDPAPLPLGSGGGSDGMSPESRAELRQAQKDAKEAKEQSALFKKQFEDERAQRSKTEERAELVSMLSPHVRPKVLDMVVDQIHSKNIMREEDTNKILWRGEDGEMLPLKDGVATWAKSDVGKEFAPVVEARGRGGRGPEGGNGVTHTPGKMTIEQVGDIVTGSIIK